MWLALLLQIGAIYALDAVEVPTALSQNLQEDLHLQNSSDASEPVKTVDASEPAKTVGASEPAKTVDASEPAKTIDASEPAKTVDASEPAKTVDASEPAKTVDASEPAKTVDASEPAKTVDASEPAKTVDASEAAKTVDASEPAKTVDASEPAKTVDASEPAKTVDASEPAKTVDASEPAKTVGASEPAKTVDASEPAKTVDASEPAKTVDASEPAKTVDASEPAKTVDASEPAKTVDASESAEINYVETEVSALVMVVPHTTKPSTEEQLRISCLYGGEAVQVAACPHWFPKPRADVCNGEPKPKVRIKNSRMCYPEDILTPVCIWADEPTGTQRRTTAGCSYWEMFWKCDTYDADAVQATPSDTAPQRSGNETGERTEVGTSNDTHPQQNVSKPTTESKYRYLLGEPFNADLFKEKNDFALAAGGSRVSNHSNDIKHAKALLTIDNSEYMLAPCNGKPWFVISLGHDVNLEQIGLVSMEFFASSFRYLQVLGSNTYPTDRWRLIGELETLNSITHEIFDVKTTCSQQKLGCWVKFVKVRLLGYHPMEDHSHCAMTRFQVFGSTVMEGISEMYPEVDDTDPPEIQKVDSRNEETDDKITGPENLVNGVAPIEETEAPLPPVNDNNDIKKVGTDVNDTQNATVDWIDQSIKPPSTGVPPLVRLGDHLRSLETQHLQLVNETLKMRRVLGRQEEAMKTALPLYETVAGLVRKLELQLNRTAKSRCKIAHGNCPACTAQQLWANECNASSETMDSETCEEIETSQWEYDHCEPDTNRAKIVCPSGQEAYVTWERVALVLLLIFQVIQWVQLTRVRAANGSIPRSSDCLSPVGSPMSQDEFRDLRKRGTLSSFTLPRDRSVRSNRNRSLPTSPVHGGGSPTNAHDTSPRNTSPHFPNFPGVCSPRELNTCTITGATGRMLRREYDVYTLPKFARRNAHYNRHVKRDAHVNLNTMFDGEDSPRQTPNPVDVPAVI